jgi:putative flavoprotein involved in K+ transport
MNAAVPHLRHGKGRAVDVVVIGAGHSGLAMSYELAARSVDHVVLERGEIANSWRHERWDSLRLLTPNWQTRLPGLAYEGDDPDAFMSMPQVIDFIDRYARHISAPVRAGVTVTAVEAAGDGYCVRTDSGLWRCRAVVLASGAFNLPAVPAAAAELEDSITTYTTHRYKNADQLETGGVLVVGGSATGLQLAAEIHASGRPVTLAVGEHVRMPRRYRGRDIQWWLDACGVLDQTYREVDDIERARRVPSPQLVGSTDGASLDLNVLRCAGVRIVGRLAGFGGGKAQFSGSLPNHCALADLKLGRLLDTFDEWATAETLDTSLPEPSRPAPTIVDDCPMLTLDLGRAGIRNVVWATGLKPDYRWLQVSAFDRKGRIRHDGGVVAVPGLYLTGLPFLRRRKSSFIHGAADDARELGTHLAQYLRGGARRLSA